MTDIPESSDPSTSRPEKLGGITRTGTSSRAEPFFETTVTPAMPSLDPSFQLNVVDQTGVNMAFTVAINPVINSSTAVIRPNIRFDELAVIARSEAIEISRHVVLDTAPREVFGYTEFNVAYSVGQALWTTFPILEDPE